MAPINYTPLAHLTDDELLREVYLKDGVTDHELELAERLGRAQVMLATYEVELMQGVPKVRTRYTEDEAYVDT